MVQTHHLYYKGVQVNPFYRASTFTENGRLVKVAYNHGLSTPFTLDPVPAITAEEAIELVMSYFRKKFEAQNRHDPKIKTTLDCDLFLKYPDYLLWAKKNFAPKQV